jgi:hypothetical protein
MRPAVVRVRGEKIALICYAWGMSKHEAVNTHTFTTEEGIKITAELVDSRLRALNIQFPGSGNRPIAIIPAEIVELAAVAGDAAKFLVDEGIAKNPVVPRLG